MIWIWVSWRCSGINDGCEYDSASSLTHSRLSQPISHWPWLGPPSPVPSQHLETENGDPWNKCCQEPRFHSDNHCQQWNNDGVKIVHCPSGIRNSRKHLKVFRPLDSIYIWNITIVYSKGGQNTFTRLIPIHNSEIILTDRQLGWVRAGLLITN